MVAGQRRRMLMHHAWTFGRSSRSGRLPAHADSGHFVNGQNNQAVQRRYRSVLLQSLYILLKKLAIYSYCGEATLQPKL